MKPWLKVLLVTIIFGAPVASLGNILWPPMATPQMPTQLQLNLLIAVSIVESVAFGLGAAFLIFGWKTVKSLMAPYRSLAIWMYAAIGWTLVSWWPHDRLHMHYGTMLNPLIGIEYGFHCTLIASSLIIAYGFLKILNADKTSNMAMSTLTAAMKSAENEK